MRLVTNVNRVALFGLIKKVFYTRGIWEPLGYMLWHGYTTQLTIGTYQSHYLTTLYVVKVELMHEQF